MANAEPVVHVASEELAERVRRLVIAEGYAGASRIIGASRSVLQAICARLPVREANLIAADVRCPKLPTPGATGT